MEPPVTYEPAMHHGKDVIFIRFEYSREMNQRVRQLTSVRWSQSQRA